MASPDIAEFRPRKIPRREVVNAAFEIILFHAVHRERGNTVTYLESVAADLRGGVAPSYEDPMMKLPDLSSKIQKKLAKKLESCADSLSGIKAMPEPVIKTRRILSFPEEDGDSLGEVIVQFPLAVQPREA